MVNEGTKGGRGEFWRAHKEAQGKRRDKREQEFIGNLPGFEMAIRDMGLTIHKPVEYHYQIKKDGNLIADYWPRPHHKYRIGEKYRNARNAGDFLARLQRWRP